MHPTARTRPGLHLLLPVIIVAAAVGLIVGTQHVNEESWSERLGVETGATLPLDLMYRAAEAMSRAEWAEAVSNLRWDLTQRALAGYEQLAIGRVPGSVSGEAALRLAVIYGEQGYPREASRAAASVPLADSSLTRVAMLVDWLYGRGSRPADLAACCRDLDDLEPWLARKIRLQLAARQGPEEQARRLMDEQQRADTLFLVLLVAQGAVWAVLIAVGAVLGSWWILKWLFTPRPPYPVRSAPIIKPWRPLDALEVWAALLILVVALKLALAAVVGSEQRILVRAVADMVGYLTAAGLALMLMLYKLRYQRGRQWSLLGLERSSLRGLTGGIGAYGVLVAGVLAAVALAGYIFGPAPASLLADLTDPIRRSFQDPLAATIYGLIAIIVAPVIEETLFRGFIYPGLRRRMPVTSAVIASAAMFAAAHIGLPVIALVGIGVLALALAFAYEKTRNLWVCIGMHAVHNALVFALMALAAL